MTSTAAFAALLLAATWAQGNAPGERPASDPTRAATQTSARRPPASDAETTLEELRTLSEAGLSGPLLELGLGWTAPDGGLSQSGEAVALVARALFDSGREAEANALLARAQVSGKTQPYLAAERARLALAQDELARVVELLGVQVQGRTRVRYPDHPECWVLLGKALFRDGRQAQAAKLLEAFVAGAPLHPEAPAAWHMLSQEALGRRDLERSTICRERGAELTQWHGYLRARRAQVRLQPDAPEPRYGIALLWMQVEAHARAADELEALLASHPTFCGAWFTLGEAQRSQGALELAEASYTRCLECDPADPRPRFNRAQLRLSQERTEAARADFEALLATTAADDPRYAAMHLVLARMLHAEGRTGEGDQAYERYLELGGQDPL